MNSSLGETSLPKPIDKPVDENPYNMCEAEIEKIKQKNMSLLSKFHSVNNAALFRKKSVGCTQTPEFEY